MRSFIKNVCIIYCIIFTVLILVHFLRGEALTEQIVWAFIFMSFFASIMTFLLKENEKYSSRRIVIQQILYLFIIMSMIVSLSYLLAWEQSIVTVGINLIAVLGIYALIKYLLFRGDKKEAEGLNEALKKRQNKS